MSEWIVAEVTKNWFGLTNVVPPSEELLCGKFEDVVNHNWGRGYVLHSFQLHQVMISPAEMVETIIAVFQRRRPAPGMPPSVPIRPPVPS